MSESRSTRRQLDPVGTRKAILEAATNLFSQSGFSATSIGSIAEAAGVTKSLVQYHFHSKEDLWEAVLLVEAKPLIDACERVLASDDPHWLEELTLTRFRMLQDRPEMARLIAWTGMSPSLVPKVARRNASLLAATEKASRPERLQRNGFSPLVLVAVLFGAVDGFFLMRNAYEQLSGMSMSTPEFEESLLQCLARAFFGYDERVHKALREEDPQ